MRYVPMDNVVNDNERRFAFWDTVRDRFVCIAGEWSWDSVEDLHESFMNEALGAKGDYSDFDGLHDRLIGLARGSNALEMRPKDET